MAFHKIRWTQSDYVTLGKAVANFNKTIDRLEKDTEKSEREIKALPERKEYSDIKSRIYTRDELKRVINSLRSFNKETSEIYETTAGVDITQWEAKEMKRLKKNAIRRLNKRYSELNIAEYGRYTKAQMGDEEAISIESTIETLNELENLEEKEFKKARNLLDVIGALDYEFRKASIYKENYLKMLENYKNFENYEVLIEELEKYKNPIEFYKYISQNDKLSDITFMYDLSEKGIAKLSDQNAFDNLLTSMNLLE